MPFWSPSQSPSTPTPSSSSSSSSSTPPPTTQPSRDDLADAELRELLAALDAEHRATIDEHTRQSSQDAQEKFRSGFDDTMNCLTAFDEMYYCFSLGGQFLNVYRYGGWRDCSEKSADWRFCMRTKAMGPIKRKAMIMARNKEKAARFKQGPNSEDIWELRKEPLKTPFSGSLGDLEKDSLA